MNINQIAWSESKGLGIRQKLIVGTEFGMRKGQGGETEKRRNGERAKISRQWSVASSQKIKGEGQKIVISNQWSVVSS